MKSTDETARYSKGGYIPSDPASMPMWQKGELVSFDGPDGPWSRVISAKEIRELGAAALAALNQGDAK